MTDLPVAVIQTLTDAGFQCALIRGGDSNAVVFESQTIIGFGFCYSSPSVLLSSWSVDLDRVIESQQFILRRAGEKAWNAYAVFLAGGLCDSTERLAFSAIEENLIGTRKLARGGIETSLDVRSALLPLLPLQTSPRLEAVDIKAEIRQRSTELSNRSVTAFLSNAADADVLQVLEEEP